MAKRSVGRLSVLPINAKESLGRIAFALSFLVLITSLLDLFVNRLLFRSGPSVLQAIQVPGIYYIAVVGAISFNFEQLVLYVILGCAAVVLIRGSGALPRSLGLLLLPQLASAALLYLPLSINLAWSFTAILIFSTGAMVFGLIAFRLTHGTGLSRRQVGLERVFFLALAVSYVFPLYYRVSVLFSSVGIIQLPFQISAYTAGLYMVMATAVFAFGYALTATRSGFKISRRVFAIALIVPSIIVLPIYFGLMESFLMTQIINMVIAMSTDILLDYQMVGLVVLASWFLLMGVSLLLLKGYRLRDGFLAQQGVGLIMILSASFLFNYPNYLLLTTTGVLLLAVPMLRGTGDKD
jgi:hypothetical protein